MVVLSLVPLATGPADRRQRCLVSFLNDEESVSALHDQLSQLQGEGEGWWQFALGTFKRSAYRFEFQNKTTSFTEVQVLLMESTCTGLTPQAWHYLWSNGYKHIRDPAAGYFAFNFLAQQQQQDSSARHVTERLCYVTHDPMTRPLKRKTHEVWRLVKQLQNKRTLQQLRIKFSVVCCVYFASVTGPDCCPDTGTTKRFPEG